jgi:hypothetical protein
MMVPSAAVVTGADRVLGVVPEDVVPLVKWMHPGLLGG